MQREEIKGKTSLCEVAPGPLIESEFAEAGSGGDLSKTGMQMSDISPKVSEN